MPANVQAQDAEFIEAIAVEGVARVDAETVRSYLLVREGDAFDAVRIDRSLKSLFSTGLFADVRLYQEGSTLVVNVTENPVINRIAFEGNLRLKDEELMTEISLKPRVIYTRTKVQNDVNRIQNLYQRSGRFAVSVEPKVIQLPQNRVDLVYEVSEGTLTEVQNIRFVGNKAFDDGDLREIVRTRETRWYRFLSSDDTYDPDRITFDRELLRRFYLKNGYADFQVLSAQAELTADRAQFFITFTVEEGKRYKFGEVTLNANMRDLKTEDLQSAMKIPTGDWYDSTIVDVAVDALTSTAGDLGYAFTDVRPKVDRDRDAGLINLTFNVEEGPRVFIERINVTGNVRTLDEVIRREFRVAEGDAFVGSKIRKSITNIENLDFFTKVNAKQVEGSAPDKAVINIDVQEKSTGSLSVGAGYSSSGGAMVEFSIKERNLLGKGQNLGLTMRIAQSQSTIDLSFTEPYFMNREIAAGFDVYHSSTNLQTQSSFNSQNSGVNLRVGYPISKDLRQNWIYTLKSTKVSNVSADASIYIQNQEGSSIVSSLGQVLTLDRRNTRRNTTEGYFVQLRNDLAGLGGDAYYLRNTLSGKHYLNISEGWVLGSSAKAGVITGLGEDVNLLDRFFVGGNNLRGFADSGVGPRDSSTNDALGGEYMYTGSLELSIPLGLPKELGITGKLFTDVGSSTAISPSGSTVLDTGSLRGASGIGLTWVSPVGPISIDFSQAFMKEAHDELESIRFNFGTQF
ncbi:MAG: outer membrane protein assembly factor BamA [Rhodospirillaceae bacterium]|nr:MAG: outer membrane protein assembly factor BamA [Rhodospirillaceae bacterium]